MICCYIMISYTRAAALQLLRRGDALAQDVEILKVGAKYYSRYHKSDIPSKHATENPR